MVLRWHHSRKEYVFQWRDWPLWENAAIGRKLGVEGASAVVEELIRTGHAEWNDAGKSAVTLMWHSAEEIAAKLFDFVRKHDMVNSVYTVYELHQGDDVLGTVRNQSNNKRGRWLFPFRRLSSEAFGYLLHDKRLENQAYFVMREESLSRSNPRRSWGPTPAPS